MVFEGCAVGNGVDLNVGFTTVMWMEVKVVLRVVVVVSLGAVVVMPFGEAVMVAFVTVVIVSVVVVVVLLEGKVIVPMGAVVVVPMGTSVVVPLVTSLVVLLGAAEILALFIGELAVVFGCIVVALKGVEEVERMNCVTFPTTTEVDISGVCVDGRRLVRGSASVIMSGVEVRGVAMEGVVVEGVPMCVVIGGLLKVFSSSKGSSVDSLSADEIECTFH